MQLKIDVDKDDPEGKKLTGYAVTFSGRLEVFGRRRQLATQESESGDNSAGVGAVVNGEGSAGADRAEGGGEGGSSKEPSVIGVGGYEEIDIVMFFNDGYSVRLVGRMNREDESVVGDWATFSNLEDAKKAFDEQPFGDDPSEGEQGAGLREGRESGEEVGEENGDRESHRENDVEEESKESIEGVTETEMVITMGGVQEKTEVPTEEKDSGDETKEIITDGEEELDSEEREGEAKAAQEESEDDAPVSNAFEFRRTPAEVYRFRDLLSKDENQAKSRWNFLRESMLFLVRRRLWSWKNIKAWGQDRQRFLDYYKRNWLLAICNYVTPNPLSPEERAVWDSFKCGLPPSNVRLCVDVLSWSLDRLPFH
jgi:hypothetical protein